MAEDNGRIRKIASNLSEGDRQKHLEQLAGIREDIAETLGSGIVNQDRLDALAEAIWLSVPVSQRPLFTAEKWQAAIYDKCSSALVRAEQRLEENKIDEKFHAAKVRILRQEFAKQVVRAMRDVAEKYRRPG